MGEKCYSTGSCGLFVWSRETGGCSLYAQGWLPQIWKEGGAIVYVKTGKKDTQKAKTYEKINKVWSNSVLEAETTLHDILDPDRKFTPGILRRRRSPKVIKKKVPHTRNLR